MPRSDGVHFLVGDSKGNCASIEFIGGKMVCHTGQTMPVKVLANSTYDQSAAVLKLFRGFGGFFPIPHPKASTDLLCSDLPLQPIW